MNGLKRSFFNWWKSEWAWLSYLVVFALAFGIFLILQASRTFADPDSFYHAKMALLLRDQGIVREFPWLQLTVLGQAYTDQHFLYHVLLIPFVTLLPPLLGLKLATVFFGATLATVMYWMMRKFNVRWAFVFILILLLIRPFTFRISLAKAPSTSLIFLFVGLTWIFLYRFKRVFGLAFAYVWYYGGFPLLGIAAAVYAGTSWLLNRFRSHTSSRRYVHNILALVRRIDRRPRSWDPNWRVVAVTISGLIVGLVINPYFPRNLMFYFHQTVNIGIINFQKVIGVGAEWYPYSFGDLAANGAFASLLILVAMVGIVFRAKAQSKQTVTLGLLTIFFLLLTLKSRRYVEYYIPTAVLFSAFSISDSFGGAAGGRLWQEARKMMSASYWSRALTGLMAVYLAVGIGYIAIRDFRGQLNDLRSGFAIGKFEPAAAWLAAHTPDGARVVHSDWDEFPVLFYYNSHNTYIVGLDPTFLYKQNPDTYWTWANITLGKFTGDVYEAVTQTLGSEYVFIASGHEVMENLITKDQRFHRIYRDNEATIYQAAGL